MGRRRGPTRLTMCVGGAVRFVASVVARSACASAFSTTVVSYRRVEMSAFVGTPMVFSNCRPKCRIPNILRGLPNSVRGWRKSKSTQETGKLLLMAEAWLLLAEHAFSSVEHQSRAHWKAV